MKHFLFYLITSVWLITHLVAQSGNSSALDALLEEHRAKRAGMYDSVESSVLGKAASPAEFAATQRNWRDYYSKPVKPLNPSMRQQLEKYHGNVKIFGSTRSARSSFPLGILGAHARDFAGQPELLVISVDTGTPADGKLMVDDLIMGANGRTFPWWEDPRVPMGYVIAAAQTEAHGGQLTLHVARNGKIVDVTIKLPVATPYDEKDPYSGPRAEEVATAAVKYILENGDDTFWKNLFLMGCGDERALARVRDNMRALKPVSGVGNNWEPSYILITLCEYHLLTGDKQVLPTIQSYVTGLEKNQHPSGGWGHTAAGGYGGMNQVGQIAMIGLTLAKECGAKIDPVTYTKGLELLGRFIGTYGAYGDHLPGIGRYREASWGDNGKMSAHAVLYSVLDEPAIARRSGRRTSYLYRTHMAGHAEAIFAIAWGSLGPRLGSAAEYSMYANNTLWIHELSRQRDGSLRHLGHTRYRRNTAATGMAFVGAKGRLRIAGKAKGTPPMFPASKLPAAPPKPKGSAEPSDKKSGNSSPNYDKWDVVSANIGSSAGKDSIATANFNVPGNPKSYKAFQLTLSTKFSGEVWLNGKRIADVPSGVENKGQITLSFGQPALSLLKSGSNVIGIKSGSIKNSVEMEAAFAPSGRSGKPVKNHKLSFDNHKRNGWVGTFTHHLKGVEWFFQSKSPAEIARYLAYPDAVGAQVAYKAMANGGPEAVALCKQLIADTQHAGLRSGAWDTLAVMNKEGLLTTEDKKEIVAITLKQLPKEDPSVGMALIRAVGPMAKGKDLGRITASIAKMDDMLARNEAKNIIEKQLKGDPEATVLASIPIMEAKLNGNSIRALGNTMKGVAKYAKNDATKEALPALARVLDEVAPVTSGMFSDSLTHGGLDIVDYQLNPETEKTPQLASGLTKIHMRGYSDWPGWAYSGLYARRLVYRLTSQSASEIHQAAKERLGGQITSTKQNNMPRAVEMMAWADLLRRTRGSESRLKTEALRMASSNRPGERTVALSLVWPSHRAIQDQGGRYSRKNMSNVTRSDDPKAAVKIALTAAADVEENSAIDWLMIWTTINEHGSNLDEKILLPLLSAYFDQYAWRNRATYHFDGIEQAWKLADKLVKDNDRLNAPQLANGLAKTYATYSSEAYHKDYEPKVLNTLKKMNKASRSKLRTAIKEAEDFKKSGPEGQRNAVFDRWCTNKQFASKINQIKDIARD